MTANGVRIYTAKAKAKAHSEHSAGADRPDTDDIVWRVAVPPAVTAAGGDLTVRFESSCCAVSLAEVWLRLA